MTEEELLPIVTGFRQAFEKADLSVKSIGREANIRVGGFPHSACAEACTVLGCYLTNKYQLYPLIEKCAQIENGELWYGAHHWLEHNGIVIDITADQFEFNNRKVIVSLSSDFHSKYATKIGEITSTFILGDEQEWVVNIYNEVSKHIF